MAFQTCSEKMQKLQATYTITGRLDEAFVRGSTLRKESTAPGELVSGSGRFSGHSKSPYNQ